MERPQEIPAVTEEHGRSRETLTDCLQTYLLRLQRPLSFDAPDILILRYDDSQRTPMGSFPEKELVTGVEEIKSTEHHNSLKGNKLGRFFPSVR